MTECSNRSTAEMDISERVHGARYAETADMPAWKLEIEIFCTLWAALRQQGELPPESRLSVDVRPGAPIGSPWETALRVCVELAGIEAGPPANGHSPMDLDDAHLRYAVPVLGAVRAFGWTNPRHPLLDRRFRVYVHLTGIHAPVAVCHLCGRPHPLPWEGVTDARSAHGSGD